MPKLRKYPPELKDLAVRLVLAARDEDGGRRGACTRVGQQLGIPTDTLRGWVRRAEVDGGLRPGRSTDDAEHIAQLERRFESCEERTRSCGVHRLSSRRSSTAHSGDRRLHRRAS